MSFSVVFRKRDQSLTNQPKGVTFDVERYSKSVMGGCKKASIRVDGSRESLWEFAEFIRRPVEIIHNESGECVWWGYLAEVRIREENFSSDITIDSMANKVAVAYTEMNKRETTAWSSNAVSVAEYGTFERLFSQREISTAAAEQRRDTKLELYKNPQVETRPQTSRGESQATLICRGWYEPMTRRYYSNDGGLEEYTNIGWGEGGGREIGQDDRPIMGQSFQLSSTSGWTATEIWLRMLKQGDPTDNILVTLYSDSGNEPNAELDAAAALDASTVTTAAKWTKFTLNTGTALSTGTTYWIRVARSGAVHSTVFCRVGHNAALGYPRGEMKLYSTILSTWVTKNMEANFKVVGSVATTTQISNIVTDCGEFITSTVIEDASGINTHLYRNGDYTAWTEILALLDIGTSNDRRLLAEVTRPRRLRIYEEDAITTVNYKLSADGKLYTSAGRLVPPEDCFIGKWVALEDVVPDTVDTSVLASPSPVFIDEAEFDVKSGRWYPIKTRGVRELFPVVDEG